MPNKRIWTKKELNVLSKNYPKIGCRKTARLLDLNYTSVADKAKELGLVCPSRSFLATKIFYNHHYFSTPNIKNNYWAGFIAADGCVNKKGITFHLSITDIEHLKTLQNIVKHTGKISITQPRKIKYKDKTYLCKNGCYVSFHGKQWSEDLNGAIS